MSYRLQPREGIADGIRRIVAEQLDDAIGGLCGADAAGRDRAIHEARKSLKKVRSALRLVRGDLGSGVRRRENAALRDAARRLSGARDAEVLLGTLASLEDAGAPLPAEAASVLRDALEERRDRHAAQLDGGEGVLRSVAAELAAVRSRVASWPLADQGFAPALASLERMYREGRRAMREALRSGDDEAWHEWRKRVKDLWYAGRILEPVAPAPLGGLVAEAEELSAVLGDHNDLAVLLRALDERAGAIPVAQLDLLRARVAARRDGLRRAAVAPARRLYAERPGAFARRMAALCDARGAQEAADADWLEPAAAERIRALLAARPAADPAQRRHIAAGLRQLGFRPSDHAALVPRRPGGFAVEDFEDLVARGVIAVGTPPHPADLAGLSRGRRRGRS